MRAMSIQIAPSILSADFCNLERDLKAIANAYTDTGFFLGYRTDRSTI